MSKKKRCAHVLPDMMPVLASTFAKMISKNFPEAMFYLRSYYVWGDEKIAKAKNEYWTKNLLCCTYLSYSWLKIISRKLYRYFNVLIAPFILEISFLSFIRLLKGPKHIIFHGYSYNFFTLFLLRLFGKKLSLIYWGGRLSFGGRLQSKIFKPIYKMKYNFYENIFVLMSPEVDYFKAIGCKNVAALPYPSTTIKDWFFDVQQFKKAQQNKRILLGNSTHHRDEYCEILDKLSPKDWERVTCMLNYGRENETLQTEDFILKYKEIYHDVFFPWQTTHPYDEYMKILSQYPFYVYAGEGQGGLGAIATSIRQGKTLFLRGDNYTWFKSFGCIVYNIDEIKDWSYEGLSKLLLTEDQARENFDCYYHAYTNEFSEENWVKRIKESFR